MKKKKRLKLGLLMIITLIVCTACNGNVTRDIRHAGFTVGGTFTCDNFYPKDKDDTSYDKIRYFTGNHLIDEHGKIYELSLSQVFANNQNCKEADTSIIVKAILDDKIIKGTDNKYYYLQAQNNVASYSEVTAADNSYLIYDLLLKDEDVVKVVTADNSSGLYYILKLDGNVYANVISTQDRNSPPLVISTKIVYGQDEYGSPITDFQYAGESLNTFIKTEDKVYRMRVTNQDKCGKYADVKCEYKIEEDSIFEKYKERIISYNGSILITDYKQMFNVSF